MKASPRTALAGLASLLVLSGALALALPQGPPGASPGAPPAPAAPAATAARASTILLVRHAEKDPAGDPKDPGLGDAGRKRAAALARLCSRAGVTHVFTSEYKRAKETAAPLGTALGVEPKAMPAGDAAAIVRALDELPDGSVSVVVGHSNTVPDLVRRLGGEVKSLGTAKTLPEDVFDRVFVVTRPPRAQRDAVAVTTLELAYGD